MKINVGLQRHAEFNWLVLMTSLDFKSVSITRCRLLTTHRQKWRTGGKKKKMDTAIKLKVLAQHFGCGVFLRATFQLNHVKYIFLHVYLLLVIVFDVKLLTNHKK